MTPKHGIHPTDKHVGQRVRMRRMILGMSQEALGDELGLTFQQVQKYKKGTNRVSASRLQHISQILGARKVFLPRVGPSARTAPCKRRCSICAIRNRLSRHVGRPPAHQSPHADSRREASAIHRPSCRAPGRPRRSLKHKQLATWLSCKPENSPPDPHAVKFPRIGCEQLLTQLFGFGAEKSDDAVDAIVYLILGVVRDAIEQQVVHYV
jgi:transcriptional regulator with XRE-family HTH domain